MGEAKWRTINKDKIEAEINRLSVEIDAARQGAERTNDIGLAVRCSTLTATHNALMVVINSLD